MAFPDTPPVREGLLTLGVLQLYAVLRGTIPFTRLVGEMVN